MSPLGVFTAGIALTAVPPSNPEESTPNPATRKAMEELEQGKGKRFDSAEELFEDLGI